MFGSDNFPLGPNGQFPKQRISSAGNMIATPEEVEDMYDVAGLSKLPTREYDFHSSVARVKDRMKIGRVMREGQDEDKFTPRHMMDEDDGLGKGFRKRFKKLKKMRKMGKKMTGKVIGAAFIAPKAVGMGKMLPVKSVQKIGTFGM